MPAWDRATRALGMLAVAGTGWWACAGDGGVTRPDDNRAPTAAIANPSKDTTVTLGDAVDFQATATDPDGSVASHSWDFGDGNGATVEDPGTHTYAREGVYTVRYEVTDDDGAKSVSVTVDVTVDTNQVPTAVIDNPSQDTTVTLGDAVDFRATAMDPDGSVASHSWDFGDGSTATVEDPGPHTYSSVGTYIVKYLVTDDRGLHSVTDSLLLTIATPPQPVNLTGVWKFRYVLNHPNGQTRVTAELMIDQPDLVWPNEARRIAKFSDFNGLPDPASRAQTELTVAVNGSQVDLQFNDTDGLETFSGTIFAPDSMGGGVLGDRWYALRSNDPPPPTVAAPSALTDSISSTLRVFLDWTDNSDNEAAFKIARQCQGDTTTFAFDSVANVTSAMDFGRYGVSCTYRVHGYLVDAFTDGDYDYTGTVFSRPSNHVTVDIPASPVTGMAPSSGVIGTSVIVTGLDFGADPSILDVEVAGQPASLFSALAPPTEIHVLMPNGGYAGRMPVTVFKSGTFYGEAAWTQPTLGDPSEPENAGFGMHGNDDAATSYTFSVGGTLVHSFGSGDSEDWFQLVGYSFYGPPPLLQFAMDWNVAKDLDLYIMDSSGSYDICGRQGVGATKPVVFQCTVQDEFGRVRLRIVDEDARSHGDTQLVSYRLWVWEP